MSSIKHFIRNFCQWIINTFFVGHHFWSIKRGLLRIAGAKIGNNVRVVGPIYFTSKLAVGNGTFIGRRFEVHGNGSLTIGHKCDLAPEVSVLTGSHHIGNAERRAGLGKSFSIFIGDGCWIGARSTIMGNISVGNGTVVGAGTLVNKDLPRDVIAVGVPAKVIKP